MILTQQCFSRLHNTSDQTDESTKVELLNSFMQELKSSGYSEAERLNILQGGINTFKNLKTKEFLDERPFYRNNQYQKSQRQINERMKKKSWYKGKKCDSNIQSVMFVEATPGDKLIKMLKATEEKYMIAEDKRIRFVSRSGSKIVNILEKKNPFEENCNEKDCAPCNTLEPSENQLSRCRVDNIKYQGKSKTCEIEGKKRVYDGETARYLNVRSKEHINEYKKQNTNSWMFKHVKNEHSGKCDEAKFTGKFYRNI